MRHAILIVSFVIAAAAVPGGERGAAPFRRIGAATAKTRDAAASLARIEKIVSSCDEDASPEEMAAALKETRQVLEEYYQSGASGKNTDEKVQALGTQLLDADPSMALLTHRYGDYMKKLAHQLQESLARQAILTPTQLQRSQVKIRFGIAPDGTLSWFQTVYPHEKNASSLMAEQALTEAQPFDPLTETMADDPLFQQMTVIFNFL